MERPVEYFVNDLVLTMMVRETNMEKRDVRTHPRRELKFEVEYAVISGSGEMELIHSRTLDFSVSGTRIETDRQLAVGDKLTVRIEIPDLDVFEIDREGKKNYQKTVVMCFGTVRWVKPEEIGQYSAGIRFAGLSVSNYACLKRLLKEISPAAEK